MQRRPASVPISNHFHYARPLTPDGYETYDVIVDVTFKTSTNGVMVQRERVQSVSQLYHRRKSVGEDKKCGGGLVISRGALSGLLLRAQREGDPLAIFAS